MIPAEAITKHTDIPLQSNLDIQNLQLGNHKPSATIEAEQDGPQELPVARKVIKASKILILI